MPDWLASPWVGLLVALGPVALAYSGNRMPHPRDAGDGALATYGMNEGERTASRSWEKMLSMLGCRRKRHG
jgi:hypothetical protein